MNTHGSYKCYCLNGYFPSPDGSCINYRTCAQAHCQYGCEEVDGEIRCVCPSAGLRLGPDERTCIDIDECATGGSLCPYNRRCVNTFGSYFCKCQAGYDLKYVNGRYDCEDINECVTGLHKCSNHADCLNTLGSYKCKCRAGFRGSGFECSAIPNPSLKSPRILGGSKQDRERIKNLILEPEPAVTPSTRTQPFDNGGEVNAGNREEKQEGLLSEKEREEEDGGQDNQIDKKESSRRGDVFVPQEFQSVFGPQTELKEVSLAQDEFIVDCNFDHGFCEWVQDREDDFDWSETYHDNGEDRYMAVSGSQGRRKDLARLNLLLSDRVQRGGFCLAFNYRLVGGQVGALRVMLDNPGYPVWEQSQSRNQDWQTELLTVSWEHEPPRQIIFEAERGKGAGGEIGLDSVVLTPGPCQDDKSGIF
ncbi:hypothetical protein GJAV_G00196830 [Gymnothorax javanicus]|nr:hypothetical protein GJAV_G00196830 [Gymnothorax javanicus]